MIAMVSGSSTDRSTREHTLRAFEFACLPAQSRLNRITRRTRHRRLERALPLPTLRHGGGRIHHLTTYIACTRCACDTTTEQRAFTTFTVSTLGPQLVLAGTKPHSTLSHPTATEPSTKESPSKVAPPTLKNKVSDLHNRERTVKCRNPAVVVSKARSE